MFALNSAPVGISPVWTAPRGVNKEFSRRSRETHFPGGAPQSDCFYSVVGVLRRQRHGVRISLDDRLALDSPALGIELIAALHR